MCMYAVRVRRYAYPLGLRGVVPVYGARMRQGRRRGLEL